MKYSQANLGRLFVVRMEDGDIVHEKIEELAAAESINRAAVYILGGADKGSKLIVGPAESRSETINPMITELTDASEISGVGTIFPDETGKPVLHLHLSAGRGRETITGCAREGVKTWHVGEVIIMELTNCSASRRTDSATGFKLLQP